MIGEVVQIDIDPSPEVRHCSPASAPSDAALRWSRCIAARTANPLVFVVDDAQWADEASSELLSSIARACRDRGWLMLVSRRNVEVGFRPGPDIELPIGPMPATTSAALIELATEAAPLRAHDVDEVVRRADGNPLFATEILRTARDAGSLDAVPLSLEATLAVQIDALDGAARRLLRYASVLGQSFSAGGARGDRPHARLATRISSRSSDSMTSWNSTATSCDSATVWCATPRTNQWRFACVRNCTSAAGAAGSRRRGEDNADALALHFSRAGDAERTWRYARIAAERARQSYANIDAARYYEMALGACKATTGTRPPRTRRRLDRTRRHA